ncbi:unnamed protein product [Paramecium pentaurelia]|uniref:Uncharacterized protein n=1 Tax=Paramecium pentaurelia TaxID=43138 RepID=A0A8S1T689_9CILI|nr:unnamed protein product [Paramecium pentaurelia]
MEECLNFVLSVFIKAAISGKVIRVFAVIGMLGKANILEVFNQQEKNGEMDCKQIWVC